MILRLLVCLLLLAHRRNTRRRVLRHRRHQWPHRLLGRLLGRRQRRQVLHNGAFGRRLAFRGARAPCSMLPRTWTVMALSPRCSWLALTAGTAAAATVLLAAAVATVLLATVLLAVAVATVLAAAVAAAVSMTGVLDPFALLEVEVDTVVIMAALVVFPAAMKPATSATAAAMRRWWMCH